MLSLATHWPACYKAITAKSNTMPPSEQSSVSHEAQSFATTRWTMVLLAGTDSPAAGHALEQLCAAYWYPLYSYVRRQGNPVEDAQDLTQEFFARLLGRKYLQLADRTRGRFRTFLLTSLKHFLINEWSKANRQKRGGGFQFVSRDSTEMETRFQVEPADHRSPEKAFDRQWALVLLARVLDRLQTEFTSVERARLFDQLKPFLTGADTEIANAELAARLGITAGNLKVTVHRLRQRYRDLIKQEILRTVDDPEMVEEEIMHLMSALGD